MSVIKLETKVITKTRRKENTFESQWELKVRKKKKKKTQMSKSQENTSDQAMNEQITE